MRVDYHPALGDGLEEVGLVQTAGVVQVEKLERLVHVRVGTDLGGGLVLEFGL